MMGAVGKGVKARIASHLACEQKRAHTVREIKVAKMALKIYAICVRIEGRHEVTTFWESYRRKEFNLNYF